MNITVTGATGFIGRRLVRRLLADNHSLILLGRTPRTGLGPGIRFSIWDAMEGEPPEESLAGADAVIHLAGEPVAQRWTPVAKRRIRGSRVDGTRRLVEALSTLSRRPAVMVCASAIGLYGSSGDEVLTESSPPGKDFLAETCVEWEKAAGLAEALGLRVVKIRTGLVLGREGGVLARMLPPFKAGLGGRLGSGKHWMSWIHIDDLVELIRFALDQPALRGAANATSPNPVTNAEFTEKLAKALRRPALFPVPSFVIKTLFGEMAEIVLASQRVLPRAAQAACFRFQYPDLAPALAQLLA